MEGVTIDLDPDERELLVKLLMSPQLALPVVLAGVIVRLQKKLQPCEDVDNG